MCKLIDNYGICPKCGGDSGFHFFVRVGMEGTWGNPAETNDHSESPKYVKCMDCGARVARYKAEGRPYNL